MGKSLVRPSSFIGAVAALVLCASSFVCVPVRADNPAGSYESLLASFGGPPPVAGRG